MWTRYRKSVYTSGKSALILGKLLNLKLVRLKQAKIKLPKVAKIYRCLYAGAGASLCLQTYIFLYNLGILRNYIFISVHQITFKLTQFLVICC